MSERPLFRWNFEVQNSKTTGLNHAEKQTRARVKIMYMGRVIAVLEPELKVFSLLMKNATICARRFETLNAMKSASPQR